MICIGLGGSGNNIIQDFRDLGMSAKMLVLSNKNDSNNTLSVTADLLQALDNIAAKDEVFLVAGLGGNFTRGVLIPLLRGLEAKEIQYRAVFTMPFMFEGAKRREIAETIKDQLNTNSRIQFLDLEAYKPTIGSMPLKDAFKQISRIISEL